jgi:hypothetical protein
LPRAIAADHLSPELSRDSIDRVFDSPKWAIDLRPTADRTPAIIDHVIVGGTIEIPFLSDLSCAAEFLSEESHGLAAVLEVPVSMSGDYVRAAGLSVAGVEFITKHWFL